MLFKLLFGYVMAQCIQCSASIDPMNKCDVRRNFGASVTHKKLDEQQLPFKLKNDDDVTILELKTIKLTDKIK